MSCQESNHNFQPVKGSQGYFKQAIDKMAGVFTFDQRVSYSMLYCTKCGETKEIISEDNRKRKE